MKKFAVILGLCLVVMIRACAFADEVIDESGQITKCKITGIVSGLIEYKKNGLYRTFVRPKTSLIYNDYVDVKSSIFKPNKILRYKGQIIVRDIQEVIIQTNEGYVKVPWYRIKNVGIYKTND